MSRPSFTQSSLFLRFISALIMAPLAVAIVLVGGSIYGLSIGLLMLVIFYEWNTITHGKGLNPVFFVQSVLGIFLLSGTIDAMPDGVLALVLSLLVVGVAGLYYRMNLVFVMAGFFYGFLPALSLIWLRGAFEQGAAIILWLLVVVWGMDIGAYFAGKSIGGPKMAPGISPNKTWAGLLGGMVMAVVFGLVAAAGLDLPDHYLFADEPFLWLVIAGIGLWSQIGDLAESALKRRFKVKDSGAIIPGHGGIMDRVDGVVFVTPVVALLLLMPVMMV